VSRGVTPVTALRPDEASDIRAGIDESESAEMPLVKSTRVRQRSSDTVPAAQARGTAFGSPSAQATPSAPPQPTRRPKTHPVTWAVAAIVIPILGWDVMAIKRCGCRLGRKRRCVLLFAWDTLCPTIGPLPVT